MAFTQTQLDAIETAIGSGELTVRHSGREITYRSMSDLLQARTVIQRALAAGQSQSPSIGGVTFSVASFNEFER